MERFAIINDKIRLNLYNICRLCGIDNPSKIKILDSLKIPNDNDEEPCLSKKIECVVGIKVKRNDQMPQSVCTLCVDKINDFFEYREMCGATNLQTRKLLGIPLDLAKRKRLTDKEIKAEGESILGLGIEDEDITDSKASVKIAKQRVKGRPKKKSNGSSKKKVLLKDEEVKVEAAEIKTEVNSKNVGKRLKVDLKKIVDPTPLLTLKEPNKRERRREIDAQKLERRRIREEQRREIEEKKRQIEVAKQILEQKKLEKKRKKKNSDPEPAIKKLKIELDSNISSLEFCSICSETFTTSDQLSTHLSQSHTVTISTYGCSSCAESFKTLDEEKDHELWHSLSKTSYICPICNVAFDKTSIFSRHVTLCKPFNLTPTVTNIHCDKCSQEFLTQNLYQWHSCFVKANGKCWHCNRIFVKASTLFKHSFKCTTIHSSSNISSDAQHKEPPVHVSDPKKNRKVRDSHIKSEPEAIIEADVSTSTSHMLTPDMLPVVVLTKTLFKPNHSFAINPEDMSIKTETDIDIEDSSHMDDGFGDANDDSDNDDQADAMTETEADTEPMNGIGNEMDQTDTYSDDDVIFVENNEEPVLVNGSPSATRNAVDKPFVLPIIIKREPVDRYESADADPPIFDPVAKIKLEPVDDTAVLPNEVEKQISPKRSNLKSRKSKKSSHKSYRERQHLVHIKQEPVDPDEVFRTAPTHNLGSAIVSLPTTSLLGTRIKEEPIRPGYDDDFDPILAMNIKTEPGLDDSNPSSPLPALKLVITKKHGTLNSKLVSPHSSEPISPRSSELIPTPCSESISPRSSKSAPSHTSESLSPRSSKSSIPRIPKLISSRSGGSSVKMKSKSKIGFESDRCVFKKPALLAEKIREELEKKRLLLGEAAAGEANDFTVPVIASVLDATTISDLPLVRVKLEPTSPGHSPSRHSSESIPDLSSECDVVGGSMRPTHEYKCDQLNNTTAADSEVFNPELEQSVVEQNRTADVSETLNTFDVDIDTVCGIHPSSTAESNRSPGKETLNDTELEAHCKNDDDPPTDDAAINTTGLVNAIDSTIDDATDASVNASEATNEDLMELAGITLNDFIKQTSNDDDDESKGHTALEPGDFSSNPNDLVGTDQPTHFDPIPFTKTVVDDTVAADRRPFNVPDGHKVSYEEINEIISTLPLPTEQSATDAAVDTPNSDAESTTVANASDLLTPKEPTDDGTHSTVPSDSSESNKLNYADIAIHQSSGSESHMENSSICDEALDNGKLKSTDEFLANGAGVSSNATVQNEPLKGSAPENADYELNSVQTLTTSAIHEQLHSLLEDISEDSLSCDIDLDDKTVDWEWESKLLGD